MAAAARMMWVGFMAFVVIGSIRDLDDCEIAGDYSDDATRHISFESDAVVCS